MGSSSNRLVALTLWIVAASVAIALLGSSTLLFPGPDVGGPATAPPGKDVVARVVAQIFAPTPGRRETPPPPPALEPATVVPPSTEIGFVPTASSPAPEAERNPLAAPPSKPRLDTAPKTARKEKGTKAQRGRAVAGAKSKGHGPLEFTPPRGPKQSHVRPAKGKGKSAGRPPAHARARR
jgi:hypothetical protein